MATYATYFHLPSANYNTTSMVHGSQTATMLAHPRSEVKLQQQKPRIRVTATEASGSPVSNAKPQSVSEDVNQQEESYLFRLPAELRNEIYKELLCPDETKLKDLAQQKRNLNVRGYNQTHTDITLYPEILSTCKRVRLEAESLLYATHVFHTHPRLLTNMPHLTSTAKPVAHQRVNSQISRWQISLRLDIDPQFTFEQATEAFSGAEYVEVRVWQAQFEACDYQVLKLLTGVRGVQVARVGGSVEPELAAWLEESMMRPMEEKEKETGVCACAPGCPGFEARPEILCGRCYNKVGVEWIEKEWDLWRFPVASH
ncbi:hypothetical protein BS50DRAFT_574517 [Corynespora cassiicola Philippines]|uniref:2EXR domain-containing protein n=1 Tax=Corynespora cassiicola Philippines TaxID=1448308 RepID=A0A2T2NKS6_CORCC|nr:hypothetical protein BS50DRAFT_574517 [Corynespora cassiicola Philippines]